jgi:hypothetical protein
MAAIQIYRVAGLAYDRDSGDIVLKLGGSRPLGMRFARLWQ